MERLSPQESIDKILAEYASFGNCFENPPQISLKLLSRTPPGEPEVSSRDIVATTAAQCYAKGVAQMRPRPEMEGTVDTTLKSGHHTTRQHTNHTWLLVGVSRSVTHDIFHENPFYNTEQQSQRYVEAKAGFYLIPKGLTEKQRKIFIEAADFCNQQYFIFLDALKPAVKERVERMYPLGALERNSAKLETKTIKCCQEIARYPLHIGQLTNFYHTLPELQLLRLFRASRMNQYSKEAKYVIGQMVEEVAKVDPSILKELEKPIEFEQENYSEEYLGEGKKDFDKDLGNLRSKLLSLDPETSKIWAKCARNIKGRPDLSDEEILDLLLNPAKNKLLADVYEIGMMDNLTRTLRMASLTFATKLSHTADSQRQRQRRTPGATPPIEAAFDGTPDFITPKVIEENGDLQELYQKSLDQIYKNVKKALESGIDKEKALLLLPNAQAIRLYETGDFFDWLHRFKQRLCFVAQEEIFFISCDQVEQILEVLPQAKATLLAPCGIRKKAQISPKCPEGDRFCDQPVFNFEDIKNYKKARLI
jgi:thymidylate synthase ThyX